MMVNTSKVQSVNHAMLRVYSIYMHAEHACCTCSYTLAGSKMSCTRHLNISVFVHSRQVYTTSPRPSAHLRESKEQSVTLRGDDR